MEINPNSQQPTGSSSPTSALGNVQRPGEYLRQIRLAQKLELNDVASDLNMPLKALTALEQDDYKSLPEPAFIKGYYRSYAKYLMTQQLHHPDEFETVIGHLKLKLMPDDQLPTLYPSNQQYVSKLDD